jgi:hypothetical protein
VANNGLEVTLTDGHDDDSSPAGDGNISFVGTFGDFQFEFVNASQAASLTESLLQTTEFSVRNTLAGDITLVVTATSDPFTEPLGDGDELLVESRLASDYISAGGAATYVGEIDTTELDPLAISASASPQGVQTSMEYVRGANFTLSSTLAITLGASGRAQVTGTTAATAPPPGGGGTTAVTVVPAPASLTMLFSGLPMLGVVAYWFRRRGQPPLKPA